MNAASFVACFFAGYLAIGVAAYMLVPEHWIGSRRDVQAWRHWLVLWWPAMSVYGLVELTYCATAKVCDYLLNNLKEIRLTLVRWGWIHPDSHERNAS